MTTTETRKILKRLLDKGVSIPNPSAVDVGSDVNPDRISKENVTLFSGTRIHGANTFIARGALIGTEGPATVENCWIGPEVELKSGYFNQSVFLNKAILGAGSHVRTGTILEEEASSAHCVGLKQTILFPFVTLGSLINFCDCLMAGGTSRKNHSEVGSSYIHFNYTPSQHKATPSLIGDVPRGVMLDQRPIFLGGQGGLVGPCQLNYGNTTAAGTICRKDELRTGRLIFGAAGRGGSISYRPGNPGPQRRIMQNNVIYIANLLALKKWYRIVRRQFIGDEFPKILHEGLLITLDGAIKERIGRLKYYYFDVLGQEVNPDTTRLRDDFEAETAWDLFEQMIHRNLVANGDDALFDSFLESIEKKIQSRGKNYLDVIQSIEKEEKKYISDKLQEIVRLIVSASKNIIDNKPQAVNTSK